MKTSLIILSMLCISIAGFSQNEEQKKQFAELPQENIFLHLNTTSLFSGERLYYKLYCLDARTKKASNLSQIGYVELVDKKGTSVFKHKIRLKKGSGAGEFFIPTNVPTGSYTVYGYTQWMMNVETDAFFRESIFVLNPYQPLDKEFLEKSSEPLEEEPTATYSKIQTKIKPSNISAQKSRLVLDQKKIGKRQKVSLRIGEGEKALPLGSYSVSIQKIDELTFSLPMTSEVYSNTVLQQNSNTSNTTSKIKYLPELRGEILLGKVLNKETKLPAKKQSVSLSLPGNINLFKIALTDDSGSFHFNLGTEYDNTTAIVQHLSEDWQQYEIVFDEVKTDFGNQTTTPIALSKTLQEKILARSVNNQIENGYNQLKTDSVIISEHPSPFYRSMEKVYLLDDYTRFNSVQETIVEVVDQVSIKRLKGGDKIFLIKGTDGLLNPSVLPMVFVDGLFLKNHQDFMDYNSKKIKSIGYNRNRFFMSSKIFQGVLDIRTIEGDFVENFSRDFAKKVNLFKPLDSKAYYTPRYGDTTDIDLKRIPDFRRQLLWLPNLNTLDQEIDFYTSDIKGSYVISVEGFSQNGKPISESLIFKVE